ncbi:sensor histidine kinase [Dyadobacter arcticus]|uniref:histidine kinase n=1 Tax=Dyadobacter arcticus TaxID=1078754 RepID=A0ABX0UPF3_9BACT|nr:7TM diverse intracellular signaling domain-containing protein [Dyadobacter arcticus]NIJ52911.1 signal transduction histidine kinase [Dyadobacter arcticus]
MIPDDATIRNLVFGLFFLSQTATFAQPKIVVTDPRKPVAIARAVYFLEDLSHKLSYQEVSQYHLDSFQVNSNQKIVQLGFRPGTVWLRFDIKNLSGTDLYLISTFRLYKRLTSYIIDENGKLSEAMTGYEIPKAAQQISTTIPTVALGRRPVRVFLRIDTGDGYGDYFQVADLSYAFEFKQATDRWQSLALGVFFLAFLLSLLLFVSLREPVTGWYTLLLFSFLIFYLNFYDYVKVFSDPTIWRDYIPQHLFYLQCWVIFHMKFLDLRLHSRLLYLTTMIFTGIFWIDWLFYIIVTAYTGEYSSILYKILYWAGIDWGGMVLIVLLLLLISLIYVWVKDFKRLLLYSIAFLSSLVGMLVSMLAVYGFNWLPFVPYNNLFVLGTVVEIIILSYILCERALNHRRLYGKTQQKLISQLSENLAQKNKLLDLRDNIASDLHDEIGTTLTSIAISTTMVEQRIGDGYEELGPILKQMRTDSQETIQVIRDTVWALNPENDAPSQLFERMRNSGSQMMGKQDIEFNFQNNLGDLELLSFTMEQRRNIYLIFREAMHNIVKHSQANHVDVHISVALGGIHIDIADNGRGFEKTFIEYGNGLNNYYKRAEKGGFTVNITSKPGLGTVLELMIPGRILPKLGRA